MSVITIHGHEVELSHEDKILFPKSKITKGDLVAYYQFIAPYLLPFIQDHPIAMHRFPDGIDAEGFYQKDRGDYFPAWIKSASIARLARDKTTNYVICNDAETLVYLANQAVITFHIWLSTYHKKNYPDRMVFDIDPPDITFWPQVKRFARELKDALEHYDLNPFVMTTGSKGLHVVVPLVQKQAFAAVRAFAQHVAQELVRKHPEHLTLDVRKDERTKKLFIDVLRNQWAQLAVAPYSVRAKEGAPVATPLAWHELDSSGMHPQKYTVANIGRRLMKIDNPWREFYASACLLPKLKSKN